MLRITGNTLVFQQDSAPPYRARETVQLLQQETSNFISPDPWPPNSPNLNRALTTEFGDWCNNVCSLQDTPPRHQRLEAAPHE